MNIVVYSINITFLFAITIINESLKNIKKNISQIRLILEYYWWNIETYYATDSWYILYIYILYINILLHYTYFVYLLYIIYYIIQYSRAGGLHIVNVWYLDLSMVLYIYSEKTVLIKLSKTSHNNSSNKIPRFILKIQY